MNKIRLENIVYQTYWKLVNKNALKKKYTPIKIGDIKFIPMEIKTIAEIIIAENDDYCGEQNKVKDGGKKDE